MSIHTDPPVDPPMPGPFRIEAVIVCVDYADYLAETLPETVHLFDRVIVVTSLNDKETLELCRKHSVQCFATDVMFRDGGPFNKAAAIQFGVSHVSQGSWVCHLDADTALPPLTRKFLEKRLNNPRHIYGVDRVNCVGYDKWECHRNKRHSGHDYNCRVPVPSGMNLGDRIVPDGWWVPIGYCQIWHTDTRRRYPTSHQANGERTDVLHAEQWEPGERTLIPEVIAIHLQADEAPLGANWKGRKTKRFCKSHKR